jgi:lipoprotein-anchoring transpeptidase ErfK/SrfK
VNQELEARVSYSDVAVKRFVRRVRRTVDRPPRDADVSFHTASLPAIPSRTGLRVDARRLRASVRGALDSIGGGRSVRGRVKVVQPKITTENLADKYPRVVTVDRANFKLRLFKDLKLAKTYKIAVGQVGLETPAGVYHVQNKAVDPAWHVPNSDWAGDLAGKVIPGGVPENPLKARWLGIYAGAGIHGTADIGSLGTAASHGCIRMAIPDVEELYDDVPVQAPVYIQ